MRLLSTTPGPDGVPEIKEFHDQDRPPYAILSHTWGDDEILFADLKVPGVAKRSGFREIQLTLGQARKDRLKWAWIDTACINKDSSAELSEAINAMFSWYQQAEICYVYLSDVPGEQKQFSPHSFHQSRWFSRGWTLQELLAPQRLLFYTQDWKFLGSKNDLSGDIEFASGISTEHLTGARSIHSASIARRMSWASLRKTTRIEDEAYSLMGLLNVDMPMLYGEGRRAFLRLQEEIMRATDDQSLFAWQAACPGDRHGLLADSPSAFRLSAAIYPVGGLSAEREGHTPHAMTNRGLRIDTPTSIASMDRSVRIQLECEGDRRHGFPQIILYPTGESSRHYARGQCSILEFDRQPMSRWTSLYVRQGTNIPTLVSAAVFRVKIESFQSLGMSLEVGEGGRWDAHGACEPWSPDLRRGEDQVITIVNEPNLPSAFVRVKLMSDVQFVLLIGGDDERRLAFDILDCTNEQTARRLQYRIPRQEISQAMYLVRNHFIWNRPTWLKDCFRPQRPGRVRTEFVASEVTVNVLTSTSTNGTISGLHISIRKQPEPTPYP